MLKYFKRILKNKFDHPKISNKVFFYYILFKNILIIPMDTLSQSVKKENIINTNEVKYIVGLGNPIVDISGNTDEETLKKYGLEFGRTVFANDGNIGFYDIIESQKDVEYIPGGSVTNSIRITNVYTLIIFSGFSKNPLILDACSSDALEMIHTAIHSLKS
jgi:hypothetical protein